MIMNACDSYFDKLTILNNKILRLLQSKDLYFPVAQLGPIWNGIVEFNVPLDTVQVISETSPI